MLPLLAPALSTIPGVPGVAGCALYRLFSPVCHQDAGRCFLLAGMPVAVCERCSAIYAGFLIGALVYPLLALFLGRQELPRWLLGAGALPMLLDVAGGLSGVHDVTVVTRVLTGATFGVVVALFIVPTAMSAAVELVERRNSRTLTIKKGVPHA
jgi:uncharacterized membrane protein